MDGDSLWLSHPVLLPSVRLPSHLPGRGTDEREGVTSELFIYCLQRFLGIRTANIIEENEQIEMKNVSASSHAPSSLCSETPSVNGLSQCDVPAGMSGLLLVLMQSYVPADQLLKGGKIYYFFHSPFC